MDELESFAAELAKADQPEQPAQGSGPETDQIDGGEAPAEDAQVASDDQPVEGDEQSEQPPEGSDAGQEDPVHEWTTASGETFKVPTSELRDGYLRTQDYTAKTQALASTIKQAQADFQLQTQTLATLGAEIGEIQKIQSQIAEYNGVDWARAEVEHPDAALRAQSKLLLLKQTLAEAQSRANAKVQQMKASTDQQFAQSVAEAEQRLAKDRPDVKAEELRKVFAHMAKLGASPTELNFMRGMPWLVVAAVDAFRWQELKSKTPQVQNKVRKLPSPTTAPRAAVPTSKADAAIKAINSRATFSTNEFARLLKTVSG